MITILCFTIYVIMTYVKKSWISKINVIVELMPKMDYIILFLRHLEDYCCRRCGWCHCHCNLLLSLWFSPSLFVVVVVIVVVVFHFLLLFLLLFSLSFVVVVVLILLSCSFFFSCSSYSCSCCSYSCFSVWVLKWGLIYSFITQILFLWENIF